MTAFGDERDDAAVDALASADAGDGSSLAARLQPTEEGVFGLDLVVRDFDDRDLQRLRLVAQAIRTPTTHPDVDGAIALAGSAAQSSFQPFPGDCDFFERVNIRAATRADAVALLVQALVETVAATFPHPRLQFAELKIGSHGDDAAIDGEPVRRGSPIVWSLADLDRRAVGVTVAGGDRLLELGAVADHPGFLKLDWVHADPESDRLTPVSKVIDATWEAPDGTITALDGVLDACYQEVYLDPATRPHVQRLVRELKPDGLGDYVAQLEGEIRKYVAPGHENYGKVAKRLYNAARLLGRAQAALALRELFDDPPARLYQVSGILHAVQQAAAARRLDREVLRAQVALLGETIGECYEGEDREELLALLRSLPDLPAAECAAAAERIDHACGVQVSAYFEQAILGDPELAGWVNAIRAGGGSV